jgi:hypothetical protein
VTTLERRQRWADEDARRRVTRPGAVLPVEVSHDDR